MRSPQTSISGKTTVAPAVHIFPKVASPFTTWSCRTTGEPPSDGGASLFQARASSVTENVAPPTVSSACEFVLCGLFT